MLPHEQRYLDASRRGDEGAIDVVTAEGLRPAILNQGVILACAGQHFGMAAKSLYHGATNAMYAIEAAAKAGQYDQIPEMMYGPGVEFYQLLIQYYPLMSEDGQYDFRENYVQACNHLDLARARQLFPVPFDTTQPAVYSQLCEEGLDRIYHELYKQKEVVRYLATLSPPRPQQMAKMAAKVELDDVFWAMIALAQQRGLRIEWEGLFSASTFGRTRNNVELACQIFRQHGPFGEGNVLFHLTFSEGQVPLIDLVLQHPVRLQYLIAALEKVQRLPQFFDRVEAMLVRQLHEELTGANSDRMVRETIYRIKSGIHECQSMLMVRRYLRIAQEFRQIATPYVVESEYAMEVLREMFDQTFWDTCLSCRQPVEVVALLFNLGANDLYDYHRIASMEDKYRIYSLVKREELRMKMLNEVSGLAAYIHQRAQTARRAAMYQNGVPAALLSYIDRY